MSTILLLLLFVLAWVVLILPKQRELRRHNALLATLVEGDEVMSGSGIYGTITAIDGDVVYLEVAPGLELKVARRAVASKVAPAVDDDEDLDEIDEIDEIAAPDDEIDEIDAPDDEIDAPDDEDDVASTTGEHDVDDDVADGSDSSGGDASPSAERS